ncbi:MAG: transcription antitermination factor NusB [Lachnospiraceae bacterium]|nr:transcription antitermination factor NusB [Lachnospiraceae bacterium]
MSRHEIREQIFLIMFSLTFHSDENMRDLILRYLDETCELKVTDMERAEILRKTMDIADKVSELDKKIDAVSESWKLSRMGKAEAAILRIALYEMLYDEDVPTKVAINEAVDLAKEYGSDESPKFINGVLAKLVED